MIDAASTSREARAAAQATLPRARRAIIEALRLGGPAYNGQLERVIDWVAPSTVRGACVALRREGRVIQAGEARNERGLVVVVWGLVGRE